MYDRWLGIIPPLFEVIITRPLFVRIVIVTKNDPLLKSSEIALLVHGLHRWTGEEVKVKLLETSENLEYLIRTMVVEFVKGEKEILKYING
jgi:hypothetical protein